MLIEHNPDYPFFVFVDKTYFVEDSLEPSDTIDRIIPSVDGMDFHGLRGCDVSIKDGIESVMFQEDSAENRAGVYVGYHHFTDTSLYTLEVCIPEGDTVTGQAYMPSVLRINWSYSGDSVSLSAEMEDSTLTSWNKCENVSKYILGVQGMELIWTAK